MVAVHGVHLQSTKSQVSGTRMVEGERENGGGAGDRGGAKKSV